MINIKIHRRHKSTRVKLQNDLKINIIIWDLHKLSQYESIPSIIPICTFGTVVDTVVPSLSPSVAVTTVSTTTLLSASPSPPLPPSHFIILVISSDTVITTLPLPSPQTKAILRSEDVPLDYHLESTIPPNSTASDTAKKNCTSRWGWNQSFPVKPLSRPFTQDWRS